MTKEYPKPPQAEIERKLTPLQFEVTQACGTEPPFKNEYWDNQEPGIYVDVVTGEPLFSSLDKFDSGTGWPSFAKPVRDGSVEHRPDESHGTVRTEVRSVSGKSHLGHVFDDGPGPAGRRYCINSAALRFIPVAKLADEGYGEFLPSFGISEAGAKGVNAVGGRGQAIVAGGCFWGMEEIIRKIPGVISTEVGYTGGTTPDPVYEVVSTGFSGHAEAVRITFDPAVLAYRDLLAYFFRMHDPTTLNRQGNDRGTQYRSAIFFTSEEQRRIAEEVRASADKSGRWKGRVVTEIVAAGPFYRAEQYHQRYLVSHPNGYTCHYLRD